MRHVWLKGKATCLEKTCIYVSRGKISKGGELETTVRVISLQKVTR